MIRELLTDLRRHGLGTAVWNLRWNLGCRIGGFTAAERDY